MVDNVIPFENPYSEPLDALEKQMEKGNIGGGNGGDGMDGRVSRLETHMTYIRRDLEEIKGDLKILPTFATKRDLDAWRWQWLATGIGIVALVVASLVGGLTLINHYAANGQTAAPAPIIIQVPTPPPAANNPSTGG